MCGPLYWCVGASGGWGVSECAAGDALNVLALAPLSYDPRPSTVCGGYVHVFAYSYPVGYNYFDGRASDEHPMNTINSTEEFNEWVDGLSDLKARAAVFVRIRRAEMGNFGEFKVLDEGVSEMKIDVGPGYRVYYAREGRVVYLLLCGGDKSTQKADIKRAVKIWKQIRG
jgi:putative addiction module killer protein